MPLDGPTITASHSSGGEKTIRCGWGGGEEGKGREGKKNEKCVWLWRTFSKKLWLWRTEQMWSWVSLRWAPLAALKFRIAIFYGTKLKILAGILFRMDGVEKLFFLYGKHHIPSDPKILRWKCRLDIGNCHYFWIFDDSLLEALVFYTT